MNSRTIFTAAAAAVTLTFAPLMVLTSGSASAAPCSGSAQLSDPACSACAKAYAPNWHHICGWGEPATPVTTSPKAGAGGTYSFTAAGSKVSSGSVGCSPTNSAGLGQMTNPLEFKGGEQDAFYQGVEAHDTNDPGGIHVRIGNGKVLTSELYIASGYLHTYTWQTDSGLDGVPPVPAVGNASVTQSGTTYKITGTAVPMNPTDATPNGHPTLDFEVDVTCS